MFGFLKDKLKGAISSFSKKAETLEEPALEEEVEETIELTEPEKEPKKEEKKPEKKGLFKKAAEKFIKTSLSEKRFEELFGDIELVLLENNVAVEIIDKIKSDLKERIVDKPINRKEIGDIVKTTLVNTLKDILNIEKIDFLEQIKSKKPYTICFFGINGSGKCVTGDTLIPLAGGGSLPIKKLYDIYKDKEISYGNDHYILDPNVEIFSLNKSLKNITQRPIALCKLKSPKYLTEVSLANGMKIKVTDEHPLLSIINAEPIWISARNLKEDMYIAVPRILNKKKNFDLNEEMLRLLGKGFFVEVDSYSTILDFLKKTYGNLINAHKELNIKQPLSSFKYHWRYNNMLPLWLYLELRDKIKIKIKKLKYRGSKSIPLPVLSPNLVELTGLVLAEGHLNEKVCEVTNKDIKIINRFSQLSYKLFKIKPKVFIDSRGLIRARIYNWSVIRLLNYAFQVPFGKKSKKLVVPTLVLKADTELIKAFLRSYIESEGHIGIGNRAIEIPLSSKKAALGIITLLLYLGIESTLSKKVNKYGTFYRVFICGASKYEKVKSLDLYTKKGEAIYTNDNLPKQYEITNLVPGCRDYIKNLRANKKMFRKVFSDPIGCTPSMINYYESGVPIPRQNLLQIANVLESKYLSKLSESEASWIKIKSVRKIKSNEKWVYDLSMEGSNFIANNIVSHNTTTIAKIVKLLQKNNLKSVIAASDTFRAASIEQLEEHSKKLNVDLIKHQYKSDPAAVAFDAVKHAKAKNLDAVLIDTAGRMHSNADLMREMEKIIRVAKPDMKIFIGESITGNDCVEQARSFNNTINIDGSILTKADIDEKGGAAISIGYITKKPILFLGVGQKYKNLEEFDSEKIIKSLGL